jgi:hypothetical protein
MHKSTCTLREKTPSRGGKLAKRKCNQSRNIRAVDFVYTSAAKFGLNWDGKQFARKNPAVVAAGL